MADNKINVGGRLHSIATGNILAGADEVLDDNKGKNQSEINIDVDNALADRYTKDETYNKNELNSLITTPDVQYVTVSTYSQLPATGSANTVYKVSSYDGTAIDATKYAEYAWDGSHYVLLSVKSAVDEVFDISVFNAENGIAKKYDTLTTALADIPSNRQKGGMSIKFVQSSDNKYVQYRLMATEWTTTVAQWQGVDDEPTFGSKNLVESGGLVKKIGQIDDGTIYNVKNLNDRVTAFYKIPDKTKQYRIKVTDVSSASRITINLRNAITTSSGSIVQSVGNVDNGESFDSIFSVSAEAEYISVVQRDVVETAVSFKVELVVVGLPAYANYSIDDHKKDKNNPHEVTKSQLGLDNVDNTSDVNKPVSAAQQIAIDAVNSYCKDRGNDVYGLLDNNKIYNQATIANRVAVAYPIIDFNKVYSVSVSDVVCESGRVNIAITDSDIALSSSHYIELVKFASNGESANVNIDMSQYMSTDARYLCIFQRDANVATSFKVTTKVTPSVIVNYENIQELKNEPINNDYLTKIYPLYSKNIKNFTAHRYKALTNPLITGHRYLLKVTSDTNVSTDVRLYRTASSSDLIQTALPSTALTANVPVYTKFTAEDVAKFANVSTNAAALTVNIVIEFYDLDNLRLEGSAIQSNTIFKFNPDDKVVTLIANCARATAYNGSFQTSPLVLTWFSDIHYDYVNLQRIIDFCKKYTEYIDDVIQTGDVVNSKFDDNVDSGELFYNWWHYGGADKVLNVIGNHEVLADSAITHVDVYNKFIAPFISSWGTIVQPIDAAINGLCYYYKDYVTKGIRLIVLDCTAWDSAQATWFEGVLSDAKTNSLAVIVASHYKAGAITGIDCGFNSLQNTNNPGISNTSLNSEAASLVDAFMQSGGEFICWIGGHTHTDYIGHLTNYPNQLNIIIDSAKCVTDAFRDGVRIVGTKTQDCFNILSVDIYKKYIKLIRIGNNTDVYLRKKNVLTYNYETHTLVNCC